MSQTIDNEHQNTRKSRGEHLPLVFDAFREQIAIHKHLQMQ
jgi:hypothetical protein